MTPAPCKPGGGTAGDIVTAGLAPARSWRAWAVALTCVAALGAGTATRAAPLSSPVPAATELAELNELVRDQYDLVQVSRNGERALFVRSPLGGEPVRTWRVVHTATGAILSSGTTVSDAVRPAVVMSPEGRTVAYARAFGADNLELVTRRLTDGAESTVATGRGLRVEALTETGVLAYAAGSALFIRAPDSAAFALPNPCPPPPSGVPQSLSSSVRFSADGRTATYQRVWMPPGPVILKSAPPLYTDTIHLDVASRLARCVTLETTPPVMSGSSGEAWPVGDAEVIVGGAPHVMAIDVARRTAAPLLASSRLLGVSDDGRYVLLQRYTNGGQELLVLDRRTGLLEIVAPPETNRSIDAASFSGDGHTVLYEASTFAAGAFVSTLWVARLDGDNDGLHDAWETTFGLNPSDATDASADVDADGQTAAQEYASGTHPAAAPVRFFAEGANNSFFATTLALFNPGDTALTANVRFLGPAGSTVSYPVTLPARTPVRIVADDAGLPFTEFSMLVEAPGQVVAERRMTWDRTTGYGSHATSGVEAPSTTWHFAEGATISGIQTFLLLQNPGTVPAAVTLRYLPSNGAPQERQHVVPAQSRVTVWVNQEGAPMQAAEFATVVQSDRPIVAERAVYRDVGAQVYGAGSAAAGVPAPLTEWSFAEGATGDFFDTYLLLANPSDQPVDATVRSVTDFDRNNLGPTLSPVIRTFSLAPRARLTLRVADQDPMLAARQVSLLVTSSAPIVAERAMWWPGPTAATWAESHADTGAGPTGTAWAVADLQSDTAPDGWETFLLVNAPESTGPLVRVRLACEDGTTVDRTLALMPYRVTLWLRYEFPETVGRRCAATLESLPRKLTSSPSVPPNRAPMRVEKAMYSGAFSAGTSTSGTRLPDPIDPSS